MCYYIFKSENELRLYDTEELTVATAKLYYGENFEEIKIQKIYKVYNFKSDGLQRVSIFVDKRAKELLMSLNGKPYGRGEINITYYLFKPTDNILLTSVVRECVAPCWNIYQIIHNNL